MKLNNRQFSIRILEALLFVFIFFTQVHANSNQLISINSTETGTGNGSSADAAITPDGRFVVFDSFASDLVANDSNNMRDIFVRDTVVGTTILISVNNAGTNSGNNSSFDASITPDGRYVLFQSDASNLVVNDTNGVADIFVRDLVAESTTLVSVNNAGTDSGNSVSLSASFTSGGRFVVFESIANNLTANDSNLFSDIFVRDLVAETTTLVSVNNAGSNSGNSISFLASITPNGRFVVFESTASDLVANDMNGANGGAADIFVRDLFTAETTLVSVNNTGTDSASGFSSNPSISADGRYVAFDSDAFNLVANDDIGTRDVYVRDLVLDTTTLVSVNIDGTPATGFIQPVQSITPNGRFVVFESIGSGLVANDNNSLTDTFVRDTLASTTTLVTVNTLGTTSDTNNTFSNYSITPDGRYVVFENPAGNLVENDGDLIEDIFIRDLVAETTTLVSVNDSLTGSGNNFSTSASITPDGRFVAYHSFATNLGATDTNTVPDVFLFTNDAMMAASGPISASILPGGRSVQVGQAATAFASIANGSPTVAATGCSISPITNVPGTFMYQATDPATNLVIGSLNTPVDIAPNSAQSFVFAFNPVTGELPPTNVELLYDCLNTDPAFMFEGFNTILLSASSNAVPDIIALTTNFVDVQTTVGTADLFGVVSSNIGSTDNITVSVEPGGFFGTLPVTVAICETNQATGACIDINQAGPSVTINYAANSTASFAVFFEALVPILFDSVNNRIFIRFTDSNGIIRGITSVSLSTL